MAHEHDHDHEHEHEHDEELEELTDEEAQAVVPPGRTSVGRN